MPFNVFHSECDEKGILCVWTIFFFCARLQQWKGKNIFLLLEKNVYNQENEKFLRASDVNSGLGSLIVLSCAEQRI